MTFCGRVRVVGMSGTAVAPTVVLACVLILGGSNCLAAPAFRQAPAPAAAPGARDASTNRAVGTVKSVGEKSLIVTTDAGAETTILFAGDTKIMRVAPGQKDLKQGTPIALSDLQAGDRILVLGKAAEDGKSFAAVSVIAMAKTDVAAKQAKDREEWQRHGLGGIVSAVDPAVPSITVSVTAMGVKKNVTIKISNATVLRRYAANSVKFDDAKPAALDTVKVGDQLRARGTRSEDGSELAAVEIVSGTFRNISGTISAMDAATGTITVQDLTTKRPVIVKVSSDSQLRKLPAPVAQRIAARLQGESPGATSPAASGTSAPAGAGPAGATPGVNGNAASANGEPGRRSGMSGGPGAGQGGGGQGGDLQQMLGRMPAATLSDLQKGDAVMVVTTEGTDGGAVTAITLLAGVEPILQASPKGQSSILSPWSLGAAPGGDSGTP
jgi:Domain of unknown function (DUF5666)